MNHKQISDLKPDTWFEFLETYTYNSELGIVMIIPKGAWMQFKHPSIKAWHFKFHKKEGDDLRFLVIGFGRSRLLKLKLREIEVCDKQ